MTDDRHYSRDRGAVSRTFRRYMSSPRVTVIIPTHGRAGFLQQALASVEEQDYSDVEVIVVDDCSNPPVELAPRSGLLLVRHERNQGPGAARNTGLAHATGVLVTFLDDDDIMAPGRIRNAVEGIGGARSHACAAAHLEVDGRVTPVREVFEGDRRGQFRVPHPYIGQLVHRREDLVQFDPTLRVSEDKDWLIRMTHAAENVWSAEVGLLIREHDGTRRGVDSAVRYTARREVLRRHRRSLDRHGRADFRASVAGAALLDGRRLATAYWALAALAAWPHGLAFKLFVRAFLPLR